MLDNQHILHERDRTMTDSTPRGNQCLAVLLTFDAQSEALIRDAGRRAAKHFGRAMPESPHRPHITLHTTKTAESDLLFHLQTLCQETIAPELTLSHWGTFPGAGVLFLGATPSPRLMSLHRQTCETTVLGDAHIFDGLYLPGAWVPHCTLAMGVPVDQTGAWIEVLSRAISLPLSVRGKALEVVRIESGRTMPVVSLPLGG